VEFINPNSVCCSTTLRHVQNLYSMCEEWRSDYETRIVRIIGFARRNEIITTKRNQFNQARANVIGTRMRDLRKKKQGNQPLDHDVWSGICFCSSVWISKALVTTIIGSDSLCARHAQKYFWRKT
jgi:hypothetical protein